MDGQGAHSVGDGCPGGHADDMGDTVQVCAAADGGFSGGYVHPDGYWSGCVHDPHPTRVEAVVCAERRLTADLKTITGGPDPRAALEQPVDPTIGLAEVGRVVMDRRDWHAIIVLPSKRGWQVALVLDGYFADRDIAARAAAVYGRRFEAATSQLQPGHWPDLAARPGRAAGHTPDDHCTCEPDPTGAAADRCEYRLLADGIIAQLNPPDGEDAEVSICLAAVESIAGYVRSLPCICPPGAADYDEDPCGRCQVLGMAAGKAVDR
jgi:hypothetical protein